MYFACSREERDYLRDSTPRFASTPDQKNENIKYFIDKWSERLKYHTHTHTQQGRQREPNVKTLRSPLSAEF